MANWNEKIIDEFRANQGRVGGPFEGASLLLLTSTGARTGRPHTTPVMYRAEGQRLLIFASYAGASSHPHWYHNLVANPVATVEVGTETFPVRAEVIEGAERDRIYALQVRDVPQFGDYEKKTTRTIPVVALTREQPISAGTTSAGAGGQGR